MSRILFSFFFFQSVFLFGKERDPKSGDGVLAGIETEMRRIGRAPGAEVRIVRPSDRSAVEVGFLFREGETSVWLHDAADH